MGWAYSVDLRERVVTAMNVAGMTDDEAAELFLIGEATVHRWKRLKRETGSLVPKRYQVLGERPAANGEPYRTCGVPGHVHGEFSDLEEAKLFCESAVQKLGTVRVVDLVTYDGKSSAVVHGDSLLLRSYEEIAAGMVPGSADAMRQADDIGRAYGTSEDPALRVPAERIMRRLRGQR